MSIFDEDQPDTLSPRKQRHKEGKADPEQRRQRREPSLDPLDHFEDDEIGQQGDFEPMDANRNRHLSSALSAIRDNGPAYQPQSEKKAASSFSTPAPKPGKRQPSGNREPSAHREPLAYKEPSAHNRESSAYKEPSAYKKSPSARKSQPQDHTETNRDSAAGEPVRNPFASAPATPKPEARSAAVQPAASQPKKIPTESSSASPRPTSPPFFTNSEPKESSGLLTLVLWALVSVAVVLSAWNMMRLSSIETHLKAVSAKLNGIAQFEPDAAADNAVETRLEARLARLENNLQPLESQIQNLQKQLADGNQSAQLNKLQSQITQLQQAVQNTAAVARPAAPKQTPTTPAAAEPQGWVINIASFASRKNAEALRDKARLTGADARVESYPSRGRTLYRVNAYGYGAQSAAENDAQRLQTELNVSGMLVRKVE